MVLELCTVKKLAQLAQLHLTEPELEAHAQALGAIVAGVGSLPQTGTEHTEPLISPLEISQRLRADVVSETNQRDRYQTLAPAVENGLYLVPKVLD